MLCAGSGVCVCKRTEIKGPYSGPEEAAGAGTHRRRALSWKLAGHYTVVEM